MRRRMLSALVCTGCLLRAADSDATDAQAKGFDPFNDKTLFGMEFSLEVPEDAESRYYSAPITIKSSKNEGYTCYLPKPVAGDDADAAKDAQVDAPKLLKKLKDKCLRRLDVYWSYELCVDQHVRQFHEEVLTTKKGDKQKKVTEHFLGRSRKLLLERGDADKLMPAGGAPKEQAVGADGVPTFKYNGKDTPYYSESYNGGDICDLTGNPRTTEVRYICDKSVYHAIETVQEMTTCNYLVVVHTKMLCANAAFRRDSGDQHGIMCVGAANAGDENSAGKPLAQLEMERFHDDEMQDLARRDAEEEEAANRAAKQQQATKQKTQRGRRPVVEPAASATPKQPAAGAAGAAGRAEVPVTIAHTAMLKKFLKGKHCFSGGQGWWQFEFCYMQYVRQIHRNDDGSKVVVKLGLWDEKYHVRQFAAAAKNANKVKGSKLASVTHHYKDGDYCEEVKANRKVRVKMQCSKALKGGQVSLSLEEEHTCQYVLRVQSPMFCGLVEEVGPHGLFKL